MKKLEISDETYEKIKNQLENDEKIEINSYENFINHKIFVRTVSHYLVGRVVKIVGKLMFLENAAWIADTGRFMNFINSGEPKEVEPVGSWFVNMDSVVDGCIWKHDLPSVQK